MGIARSALELLCRNSITFSDIFKESQALTLGRQTFLMERSAATKILSGYGFHQPAVSTSEADPVSDNEIFSALGFHAVESMDISEYESATIVHDLNLPVSKGLHDRYSLIFDGGTSEHVFNLPVLLDNLYKMCREGGVVIHAVPTNNSPDHGFYQFSPTFLTDYYTRNGWRIIDNFITISKIEDWRSWRIFDYKPGCLSYINYGGGGGDYIGHWIAVQKVSGSSGGFTPYQSRYVRVWSVSDYGGFPESNYTLQGKLSSSVKSFLRRHLGLRAFIMFFYVRLVLRYRKSRGVRV